MSKQTKVRFRGELDNPDLYDFGLHMPQQRTLLWPRPWQMPDGLVPGDVRHEAARGPMWPSMWTPVRKAVLEVVL